MKWITTLTAVFTNFIIGIQYMISSPHCLLMYLFDLSPLTAGAAYIRLSFFISTLCTTFEHVKDKMGHQSAIFENS